MFLVTSPIVINVPTRGLLAVETMHAIVQWLANLNIKRNLTSMFVNKKHRYFRALTKGYLNFYFITDKIIFSLTLCYYVVFTLEGKLKFIHSHRAPSFSGFSAALTVLLCHSR